MNEFIQLRQSTFEYENTYDFMRIFLEKYLDNESNLIDNKELFLNRFNNLIHINNNKQASEDNLLKLLSYLGDDSYIDRYSMDTLMEIYNNHSNERFINILTEEITNSYNKNEKLYHLLDLTLELNLNILSKETIYKLLEKNKENFDIVSLLIEYIGHFKLDVPKEFLYEQFSKEYPDTIKIQIFDVLDTLYSINNLNLNFIQKEIRTKDNYLFIDDYVSFLNGQYKKNKKGIVLLQSMFYGDFEGSGKGNNGGLAILLQSLGNEISNDVRIDRMITITISDIKDKVFMLNSQKKHLFVRLPIYLNRSIMDPFLKRELFIKRYIKSFLIKLNIQPDLFHIRYLDNASMAVAKLSKELNKKLVLTLAPDPHRNMSDEKGYLKYFDFNEIQLLLNKIKIGDQLILESDKILGIGAREVSKEFNLYFPQIANYNMTYKMKMIAEGIKIDKDLYQKNKDVRICQLNELVEIDPSFCEKPIILNVGRLAELKGQVALFKAWSKSRLNKTHNLLIIGGNLKNPNQEEKEIIDFFNHQLKKQPELKDTFFHEGAMPNEKIKVVETSIMNKSFDYPHIYIASSLKEEFGIAILEAMSRGFLVLGPIKGGVKSYITNRENGFLIDTSSHEKIAKAVEDIIYNSNIRNKEFKEIQKAGKDTIEKHFSIDKIARTFTNTYLSLLGGLEDEL